MAHSDMVSAAYDMYDALKDLLECCELNLDEIEPETEDAIDKATLAIMKAEGRDNEPSTPPVEPLLKDGLLRIVAAAIKDVDGKIWQVPPPGRHHNVIALMRQSGYEGPVNKEDQQGFVLSDGRFCRRKAALRIAEDAGQLKNGKIIGSQLTTEDLW